MNTYYKKLLLLTFSLVIVQLAIAQEKVTKKIEESYPMTNEGELQIDTKYGNVNIFGWNKDEISVTIKISVKHRKRENAEDFLKRINPILRSADDYLSIGYEISNKRKGFFNDLFNNANPFDFDRSNVQIDYTVYLPKKAELNITNKFGDIIIEDWMGKLRANLEHGDLWINEDLNRADIIVKYGKLRTKSINYGSLDVKNGEVNIQNSKSIRMNSSGTEINIHRVSSFEIYSNKDEITIEEAGTLFGNLKFSTFQLQRLDKDVDLNIKIVDLVLNEVTNPMSDISIEQESSEISLNISGFSHQFNATIEEGLVRLPKSYQNVNSTMLDSGKRLRKIEATYGKDSKGAISIQGKKGIVQLRE